MSTLIAYNLRNKLHLGLSDFRRSRRNSPINYESLLAAQRRSLRGCVVKIIARVVAAAERPPHVYRRRIRPNRAGAIPDRNPALLGELRYTGSLLRRGARASLHRRSTTATRRVNAVVGLGRADRERDCIEGPLAESAAARPVPGFRQYKEVTRDANRNNVAPNSPAGLPATGFRCMLLMRDPSDVRGGVHHRLYSLISLLRRACVGAHAHAHHLHRHQRSRAGGDATLDDPHTLSSSWRFSSLSKIKAGALGPYFRDPGLR
ncbi:hypothetical protein EVAR_61410_1 [Eumeta japonica]|uniref:Uncharacterized protein n=1 Tax=Eumeta variegata TaxID=151549 RepID=A0A4C1YYZ2_EUMVA|nr:hypothetical protein EVAR_61410_1 [Eumeta japonica]